MLKYQLNRRFIRNDLIPINLTDYSSEEMLSDNYKDKLLLTCYSDSEITFDTDARIIAMYEQYMVNDDFISSTAYDFNTVFYPAGVNKENRSFSIIYDKYFDLEVDRTYITSEIPEGGIEPVKTWWYICFNGSHLFDVSDGSTYELHISFYNPNGDSYAEDFEVNSESYVSNSILKFPYVDLANSGIEDVIFYVEDGEQISDVSRVKFFRDNFIFTDGMFELYLDKPMATISLPITQKFATDLYQDDAIREDFTDVEIKKSINKIVEMEKDVYHPVIWDGNKKEVKNEVYKIRFNLHFRAHRGDDWIADANSYWNGTYQDASDNKVKFVEAEGKNETKLSYFIYKDKERQSDLLTYLNFTDKDVRYQKNKLKKSFLRVMFFDSTNPANQNMLAYYTVFMDSGSYFSKYARYIETEGYKKFSKDLVPVENKTTHKITYEYTVKEDLTGIKVDREPTKTSKGDDIVDTTSLDDIEAVRLSSQLVVEDKYMSDASSEGFYLYLWKDNFLGEYPQDIYMKVEFNHAGYGRTIPFMCPFWDSKKYKINKKTVRKAEKGFKTFKEILDDWNANVIYREVNSPDRTITEADYNELDNNEKLNYFQDWSDNTDGHYGIRQYLKYSYIHFKYQYDKKTNHHVYYLDDEFYGTDISNGGVYFDDNAITINLYEAKIV